MPANPMAATTRYFRPGITRVYWVETIADITAPTRAELDDGVDLSAEIFQINGFQVQSAGLPTPDFGSRFTSSTSGEITAPDSNLVTYADVTSVDIRTVLARDDSGNIVIMDEGDVVSQLMDLFAVQVGTVGKLRPREDPARHQTDFFFTRTPAENIQIPS